MDAITLPSGHTLELGDPGLQAAKKLLKTIARELKQVDVSLEIESLANLDSLLKQDVNQFKNLFLQIVGSDAIESCIAECSVKSMLEGQRITGSTFEPRDLRPDYLPVAWEVMKFNVTPFFASLSLPSSILSAAPSKSPP